MNIPAEVLFSPIKGGVFETDAYRGWWWKSGKLIASWHRGKDGRAVVTWNN